MKKEEAIEAGIKIDETKHNMKRRKPWHNYHRKGTYMLTMVVEGRQPLLGRLVMPTEEIAQMNIAHVEPTELGKAILNKVAIIVHSAYSDEEFADYKQKWLACGERGGVLVSAAIAIREKEVMREAMNRGYRASIGILTHAIR